MIHDLDRRRAHWDVARNRAPRDEHDMSDSLPYPFEEVKELFVDRDVLEIGPGRGRQYANLYSVTRSYAICDISPAALSELVFTPVQHRLLLADYGEDFGLRFDIVHFWYVLHHICPAELNDFMDFVFRHLRLGGSAIFNSPQTGNDPSWYADNGMGTTWIDRDMVIKSCQGHFDTFEEHVQNDHSSGSLFIMRKWYHP